MFAFRAGDGGIAHDVLDDLFRPFLPATEEESQLCLFRRARHKAIRKTLSIVR